GIESASSWIASNPRSAETTSGTADMPHEDFKNALDAGAGPIRLIEQELALADAAPLKPLGKKPVPYHGYYVIVMERDDSDCIFPSEEYYKQDTDGKLGKVHNISRFGFCAFPASYGKTGRYTFIIKESNTPWKLDTLGK